jgi:hypothetical protein
MKNFNWNFVLAIVASLATMLVVVMVMDTLGHKIYPPPEGMTVNDKEMISNYLKTAPIQAILIIPIGWILGAFAGAFVGGTICKQKKRIIFFIVAIFTLLASLSQLLMIQHPWYFWVLVAFIFPGALLGSKLVKP